MNEDLYKILEKFPTLGQNKFDLREIKDLDLLVKTLKDIIQTENLLMHGSPAEQNVLEPRQANDIHRESGNRLAVYATDNPERAVFHAVLNIEYLKTKFDSFISGYSSHDNEPLEFKVTENIMGLIEEGDGNVFCDGYIYLLERDSFESSEDDDSEYHSKEAPTPLACLVVSRDLGADIKKRTHAYNKQELEK